MIRFNSFDYQHQAVVARGASNLTQVAQASKQKDHARVRFYARDLT